MRWAERCCTVATLCIAATASAAAADQSKYGKVDTFEPGKKYDCVPSADHKSWDCSQTGKVSERDAPPPSHDEPVPAPAKPRPAATASPPPSTATPRASALPSYLLAPGASDHAASAPPPPAPVATAPAAAARAAAPAAAAETPKPPAAPAQTPKPAATPIVHSSTNPPAASAVAAPPPGPKAAATPPAPEPAAAPVAKPAAPVVAAPPPEPRTAPPPPAPKPAEPAAEKPAAPVPAAPSPAPVSASVPMPARTAAASGSGAFLKLPGEQYVIELAHAEHAADIATARAAVHVPRGEVYELHLRQNGGDVWLLVWGSFDDVGAARAARGELPADVHAGWPRRVAPLQAEVRRAQE